MSLVIAVAQQKGGAGKTSLAAHLSVAWSSPPGSFGADSSPLKVVALDLDPQESLSRWFAARLAAGLAAERLEVHGAAGWRLSGELLRAKREADIVVLDLPPGLHHVGPAAFRGADLALVPLQLSPMDLWATAPTIDLAKKSGTHPLLVLNRVPPRARLNDIVIGEAKAAGWQMARAMLGNRTAFASSLMNGRGVSEEEPHSLAAAELRLLAHEILATTRSLARAA